MISFFVEWAPEVFASLALIATLLAVGVILTAADGFIHRIVEARKDKA